MTRHVTFILAIFLMWTAVASGQTDRIKEKIRLINSWTASLDTLKRSREGDAAIIDSLNVRVTNYLLQILNDKNIARYKVDSLLQLYKTKSPDNKVIVFSFFENTGGSYKSHVNIIYYRLPDGQSKAERLTFCKQDGEKAEDSYDGTIDTISIVKSNGQTKYLCQGGGISCNTCAFNYIVLLSIAGNSLQRDFCLHLDYRQRDGKVDYNPETQVLSYQYTVSMDDSLYGTDCNDGERISDNGCMYSGQYQFNGDTFVEIQK